MSHCRVILRLLDDWPMLQYNLQYGLGKPEEDQVMREESSAKRLSSNETFSSVNLEPGGFRLDFRYWRALESELGIGLVNTENRNSNRRKRRPVGMGKVFLGRASR